MLLHGVNAELAHPGSHYTLQYKSFNTLLDNISKTFSITVSEWAYSIFSLVTYIQLGKTSEINLPNPPYRQ